MAGGAHPTVVGGVDKGLPFVFIGAGVALAVAVRRLRVAYFRSLWNLTPAAQWCASQSRQGREAMSIDTGWGVTIGGGGALAGGLSSHASSAGWMLAAWAAVACYA